MQDVQDERSLRSPSRRRPRRSWACDGFAPRARRGALRGATLLLGLVAGSAIGCAGSEFSECEERTLLTSLERSPVEVQLNAVASSSARDIAVGEGGVIVMTSDESRWDLFDEEEAVSWERVHADPEVRWRGVEIQGEVAIAVGDDGRIARSGDGGRSWSYLERETGANLYDVVVASPAEGPKLWVVVGEGEILVAERLAERFVAADLPDGVGALRGVSVDDDGVLLAAGEAGQILRSLDGMSWDWVVRGGDDGLISLSRSGRHSIDADGRLSWGLPGAMARLLEGGRALAVDGSFVAGEGGWVYLIDGSQVASPVYGVSTGRDGDLRGVAETYDFAVAVGDLGEIVRMVPICAER